MLHPSLSNCLSNKIVPLIAALIVLLAGLTYGAFLYHHEQSLRQEKLYAALYNRLDQVNESVTERVNLYWYGILGLRSAVHAKRDAQFDYTAMQRYMDTFDFAAAYPGARGVGMVKYVESQELQSFLAVAAAERPDNAFDIRTLKQPQSSHFIIQYIEPEVNNYEAVGLDIGSEASRRFAALEAAKNNEPRLTAPITLVQANDKVKYGFLILAPIYHSPKAPEQVQGRLDNLLGWSYSPLLINEVLSTLLALKQDISIQISDVTSSEKAMPFYQSLIAGEDHTALAVNVTSNLFGRTWKIEIWPNSQFIRNLNLNHSQAILNVAVTVSMLLACLTFIGVYAVGRRRLVRQQRRQDEAEKARALSAMNTRLEQEVKDRTQEVVKYNQLQTSIVENSGYAIIAADPDGTISQFNPAAEKLLGYSQAEVIGKTTPAIFHLEQEVIARAQQLSAELGTTITPGFDSFVAKAKLGVVDTNRWTYITKSGKHVQVRLNVTALTDEQGEIDGFLGIAFDLTEQIAREQELSQAKEAAEQAAQAKAEFLANMSHEIRTPMNGLYGTLQLLKSESLSDSSSNLVDKAIYSIKSLNIIINDILDYSKIEAGKIKLEQQPFNIAVLVEHLRSEFAVLANNKQLKFRIELKLEQLHWLGDEVRVRQILLNLLSNAVKFTHSGSVKATIAAQPKQTGLVLVVEDSGIGMSQQALKKLFSRFEQADSSTTRKFGGTGLGLSITKSLVDLMQGTINVTSEEGKGTRFTVELPLTATEQNSNSTAQPLEEIDLSGVRVLLAEDNPINQLVVRTMLSKAGAHISIANNGVEAVTFCQQQTPDLILMDIQMPELDGVEACKKIKALQQSLTIIALTANAFAEDKALYERVGFDDYVAKPVELHVLLSAIAKHLPRR
ncbi:CHASE domain-containing protein [Pseudoalteromonas 'SMAR']|uniref:CHASE domain-containing protein n=1 Tax=Pseudoalteromonas 'SMAR' TaxID=3416908 RepID=UPI003AF2E6EA